MKKNSEKFNVLCILAKAETQRYRTEYDKLKAKKKETIEKIKANYLPNTPLYKQEIKKAEETFQTDVARLKADYSGIIGQAIDDVREEEFASVQAINETKLAKIRAIADIPMTAEELLAVSEKYETESDYWCSRMLQNIAESNGIDGFSKTIEASFSVKENILNQIADQTAEMIRDYDGTDQREVVARQRTMYVLLSDSVIENCRALWNGEYNTVSDSEAVKKAYMTVCTKHTDIEKGLAMANVLKNAKGEKRNMLLCQLAEDERISEFACSLSGYGTEIESFRRGKAIEYRKAQKTVEEIAKTDDEASRKEIVARNSDNEFLNGIIKAESRKNKIFKEYVADIEESVSADNSGIDATE